MDKKWIYVKKGRLRVKIIIELNKPQTATELAKKLGKHRSSVSRTLLDLAEQKLVMCINPEDDRERHYEVTKIGKKTRKELLRFQLN